MPGLHIHRQLCSLLEWNVLHSLSAWKFKPSKQNASVTWISKYKTLLVKEGEELGLRTALRTSGNQILAQSGSLTPLMCLSRACLKPPDLHLWQNRHWEGRKIKTTALPVHLSEPVTSVLLISGRGSYSVRPEGRKTRNVICSSYTDSLSLSRVRLQGSFLKDNPHVSLSTAFPASSIGLAWKCRPVAEKALSRHKDWVSWNLHRLLLYLELFLLAG